MLQRKPDSIKLVIFDLGNVLFPFDHTKLLRRLEKCSPFSSLQIVRRYVRSQLGVLFDEGRVEPKVFFARVKELHELSIDFDTFQKIWNSMFLINESVADLIRRLSKNYKVFALSDTNKAHFEYLCRHYRIFDYIDECVLSFCEGIRKPDARIFERALAKANVSPAEAVFVDDLKRNISAARRIGIKAIKYRTARQLEEELTRLKVCVT